MASTLVKKNEQTTINHVGEGIGRGGQPAGQV
jgi:hypothetical protein